MVSSILKATEQAHSAAMAADASGVLWSLIQGIASYRLSLVAIASSLDAEAPPGVAAIMHEIQRSLDGFCAHISMDDLDMSEPRRSTDSLKSHWNRPEWSDIMILEGVMGAFDRLVTVLNGWCDLITELDDLANIRSDTSVLAVTAQLRGLHDTTNSFLKNSPARPW